MFGPWRRLSGENTLNELAATFINLFPLQVSRLLIEGGSILSDGNLKVVTIQRRR